MKDVTFVEILSVDMSLCMIKKSIIGGFSNESDIKKMLWVLLF